MDDFDLIVIGGGSGGVRAARIAALHGAKVALCEKDRMGGTCVIRGCIPKKLFFYASQYKDILNNASYYGWGIKSISKKFISLIENKNKELKRLENIYNKNVKNAGVKIIYEEAIIESNKVIKVGKNKITAKNIIISTGGMPKKLNIVGNQYCINSDQIMELKKIPKLLTVVGSGYIAVEFAFIFSSLGSKVNLICRKNILRGFDKDLVYLVKESLISKGVNVYLNEQVKKVSLKKNIKEISLKNSNIRLNSNEILTAIGREPNTSKLNLEELGIKLTKKKAIKVNKDLMTNIKNIFAVGDVTDRINLTPVAIAEGQFLSDKLFGKSKVKNIDLSNVGTAVFSSPPISSIGPTENEAKKKYNKIEIYESKFTSLKYSIVNKKIPTYIKLIVNGINKRVIAAHMFGEEAPEIIQLIGVAIEAKATIHNFNNTMAIHPTVAEEFVTFKKPVRVTNRV